MKQRVVLLLSTFPQPSETFIVSKFLGLLNLGWDVQIVCSRFQPAAWQGFAQLRARPELKRRVHQSPPAGSKALAALLFLPVLLPLLARAPRETLRCLRQGWKLHRFDVLRRLYLDAAVLRLRPDIVHIEFGALAVGRETLGVCLGSKLVVSFRGYDLNFSGLDQPDYYHKLWQYADALHLLGSDLWQRAVRRGCPPAMRHALIPPAVDVDFFDSRGPGEAGEQPAAGPRPLRILSVGRLEWKKGYEYGLQAVKQLVERGIACEYRIVGGGAYLEALSFARHQLGLDNVVQFCGSMNREQVKAQYEWADLFLHPSLSEGFCNVVMEAQAMQLPVVCSDAGSLPENIEDGITGYVTPRRSPDAMAARLLLLAGDRALRQRMGAAGRKRVCEHFRIPEQMQAFDRLYRDVLEGSL